jgi:glycosyltransferase involved in cell wall biosynthesis
MSSKVSVVIPCFNQGEFLEEAVESVKKQSYKNWECIIINDGSIDNTSNIAKKLVEKDSRIKFFEQENQGLAATRNNAIEKSKGRYVLPLDADDKIGLEYLEKAVNILDSNLEMKLVYAKAEKFGAESGIWELPPFSLDSLLFSNMIFCSALFRKSDFDNLGGYNLNMKYGWEDWDLWLRLLSGGGGVFQIPSVQFYYRIRPESMVRSIDDRKRKEMFDQIVKNNLDLYLREVGNPVKLYQEKEKLRGRLEKVNDSTCFSLCKRVSKFIRRVNRI